MTDTNEPEGKEPRDDAGDENRPGIDLRFRLVLSAALAFVVLRRA